MECSLWWNVFVDQSPGSEGYASHDYEEGFEERCYFTARTGVHDWSYPTLSICEGSFLTCHTWKHWSGIYYFCIPLFPNSSFFSNIIFMLYVIGFPQPGWTDPGRTGLNRIFWSLKSSLKLFASCRVVIVWLFFTGLSFDLNASNKYSSE